MSRICMLNPFFLPYQGGTEKHVFEVGRRLAKTGFKVTVLTVRMPGTNRVDVIDGITIKRINALLYLNSLPPFSPVPPPVAFAPMMNKAIRQECRRQDVFHIHNRFFYSPSDARDIKKAGRRLCLTLHNARTKGISPTTDFFGQLYDETNGHSLMRECDHIFGVSQNTLDVTVPAEYASKTSVAYNGVDTAMFSPHNDGKKARKRYGLDGRKVLLTVCRLEEQKGLRFMVEALRKLVAKDDSYYWVLVGRGSLEEWLQKTCSSPSLRGHFKLIAQKVPDGDLAELYAACDAFVLPSVWEPFGMVLCEAMSTGKPVVSTTAGGIPEVVSPDCGFLCKPRNSRDLESKIERLFSSESQLERMGKNARGRMERHFTWDHTAQYYVKLYESIL